MLNGIVWEYGWNGGSYHTYHIHTPMEGEPKTARY
jgi:hypothetical protein